MKRRSLRVARGIAVLCVVWLAAIVAGYYVLHKPVGLPLAGAFVRAARDVAVGLLLLSLAGGLGRRILSEAHPDLLAALALQGALGLGCLSLGLLGLGVLGFLTRPTLWAAVVILVIWLRKDLWGWVRQLSALRAALLQGGRTAGVIAALSAFIAAAALVEAIAPAAHFDALVYHLALPLDFLDSGSVHYAGGSPYWGMPLGAELLYAWAIALGAPETAAVLGWCMGILALLGVLGIGRSFGPRAGWAAVAALLCGETLAASLGWAYADWVVGLFGAALMIALDRWDREQTPTGAALAGVIAGMAVGAKYTAAVGWIGAGAVLLAVGGFRRGWRNLAAFSVAALLVVAPWLLKNLVYAGAPLFPFFGANPWVTSFRQALYRGDAAGIAPLAASLTPVRATLLGVEGAPGHAASLGPLLLGLIPGALLVRRASARRARRLAVFVIGGWLVWGIGSVFSPQLLQSRLYYVLYPAWALLAGAGFAGLARIRVGRVRLRRLVGALLFLTLAVTAVGQWVGAIESGALAAALGLESGEAYLARRLGAYEPAMQAVTGLGGETRVLFLWEARGLYCRPNCQPDHWIDRWATDRHTHGTAEAILAAWQRQGFTHVLLYRAGASFVREHDPRYSPEDWDVLNQVLQRLHPQNAIGDAYMLYEVPR